MDANSTDRMLEMISRIRNMYSFLQKVVDIQSLKLMEQLIKLYQYSLYSFILIGASGLIFNMIFSRLVIKGLRSRHLSPKRYLFVLNRSVSDAISSLLVVSWSMADLLHLLDPKHTDRLHLVQISLGYCSVTGSMLALAIVTFLATKYPFYYHSNVTPTRCVWFVSLTWLVSIAVTVALTTLGGNQLFTHKSDNCDYSCQLVILCASIALLVASFLSVPLMYSAVLVSLYRRTSDRNQQHNCWQLGVSIISYTILNCPFVMLTVSGAILLGHERQPLRTDNEVTTSVFVLRLFAAILLSVRALLDPLLGLVIDINLRGVQSIRRNVTSVRNTVLVHDSEGTHLLLRSSARSRVRRSASVNEARCARRRHGNLESSESLRIGIEQISRKITFSTGPVTRESQC